MNARIWMIHRPVFVMLCSLLLGASAILPCYVLAQEDTASRVYDMPEIVAAEYKRVEGLIYPDVQTVACSGDRVLFGTAGAGLCMYDAANDAWYLLDETRGLSNNTVTAVAYVPGHLWIGTSNGLNRYSEGTKKWTYYTRKDGLPSDHITALASARGNLYVGTEEGLAIYNVGVGAWRIAQHGKAIRSLAIDTHLHNEAVWIGTDTGIIILGEGTWSPFESRSIDRRVRGIAIAGERVWIAHGRGIMLYDRSIPPAEPPMPKPWKNFVQNKMSGDWGPPRWTDQVPSQLIHDFVQEHVHCVEAIENRVWIGTTRGWVTGSVFSDNTVSWTETTEQEGLGVRYVKALVRDDVGNLWIGTAGGAYMLNASSGAPKRCPQVIRLTSGQIRDVLLHGNHAYVATFGGGLNVCDARTYAWSSVTKMDGLGCDFLTAIAEHQGVLWLGSFGGGVTRYDPRSQVMRVYTRKQGLLSNAILDIAAFDRKIWSATPEGLSVFDPVKEKWYAYEHGGLVAVEPQAAPAPLATPDKGTSVIALDGIDNRLWVLKEDQLGFIEKSDTLAFHRFTLPDMGDTRALSCVMDTYEAIWIGQGAQIKRFDKKTKTWRIYGEEKGLGKGQVKSLTVCKGDLWAATYTGLCRYSALTDRWRLFGEEDGLRVEEVQTLSAWGPVLLIGGRNGVSMYHVEEEWWRNFVFTDYFGVLRRDDVRDVVADSQYVWLAPYGGGIARYDNSSQVWALFTEADGLPNNAPVHLELEDNALKARFYDDRTARFDRGYGAWEPAGETGRGATPSRELLCMLLLELPHGLTHNQAQRGIEALHLEQEQDILHAELHGHRVARFDPVHRTWGDAGRVDSIAARFPEVFEMLTRLPEEVAGDGMHAVFLPVGLVLQGNSLKPVFYDLRVARFDKRLGVWGRGSESDAVVARLREGLRTLASLPQELAWHDVQSAAEDGLHRWVTTRRGAWRFDTTRQIWKHYSGRPHLATDQIQTVEADERNLWLGTAGQGVVRFNKVLQRWEQLNVSARNLATAIVPDGSDLWVGTDSSMVMISQEGGTVRRLSRDYNLLGFEIKDIEASPDWNTICVATGEGISLAPFEALPYLLEGFGRLAHSPYRYPNWVRWRSAIARRAARSVWTGYLDSGRPEWERFWRDMDRSAGMLKIGGWALGESLRNELERRFQTFRPWRNYTDVPEIRKDYESPENEPALAGREASGITLHREGRLGGNQIWISTSGGLNQLTPARERWRREDDLDGLRIHKAYADDRRICFGTSQGAYIYDRGKDRWKHLATSDGLIDDEVLAIASVENEIWIGTPEGASVYHTNEGRVRSFTRADGMAADDVSDMAIDGRFVWVVHPSNGLSRYDRTGHSWTVFRSADGVPHHDEGR